MSQLELKEYLQNAKAFVFAAEEDFGIIPVEAQACGTPVIAYAKGGILETVVNEKTGLFFNEQTVDAIKEAITVFEPKTFDSKAIRAHALQFSKERFEKEIQSFVDEKYQQHLTSTLDFKKQTQ